MHTERKAIVASQHGSRDAFGEIVTTYMRRAYFGALALVGNREDALDVSQDAFVKAFRAIGRFDVDRPFYPWFYRILRNLCFDLLRKRKSRAMSSLSVDINDRRFDPEMLARRDETRRRVWAGIGKLRDRDREILVMRHFQHLSYKEIALALDIPQGTVMSRLFTARSRLRKELETGRPREE